MEIWDFLKRNFDVPPKNRSEEVLRRWRKAVSLVKNPKRRFRNIANLDKRSEAKDQQKKIKDKQRDILMETTRDFLEPLEFEEGGGDEKDKGGGGKGGGGSEKEDKPDDSEKKDKEGGGRAGEKKDKTSGELRTMEANKVYGGWFMYGPGTCAEAVVDEPKQEEWLLTVVH